MDGPSPESCDYLIVGAGVLGLALGHVLLKNRPGTQITFLEKEDSVAFHSSGRNSGVLHAGFYYTANSLKAKFTRDGNQALKSFCAKHGIAVNPTKKVVTVVDESELPGLDELARRGAINNVNVSLIDEKQLAELDPNVRTIQKALYSPETATVDPSAVCDKLREELLAGGATFHFGEGFAGKAGESSVKTTHGRIIEHGLLINSAGLYADKIARQYGFSQNYEVIPFKGIYLKYTKPDRPVRINVYPVPNLSNPFLGVHFTITADNQIKIGPTAIPAFWRENYKGLSRFRASEFLRITSKEAELFARNSFNFRRLAYEEMKKYRRSTLTSLAARMVHKLDPSGFSEWSKPGIRAQLLDLRTNQLMQDFLVEGDGRSVHILNAVSPAFTSSFPFANWIFEHHINQYQVPAPILPR